MKVLNIIRTNEWWEYKFPPILAAGYMVAGSSVTGFANLSAVFLILLLSLITGAAYVSLLNDATDIADDAAANKPNRVAGLSLYKKIWLIAIPLIAGALFTIYYSAHKLSMVLYICCHLCFTLYSLPPFRLKKRGVSGILADAAGSQLFPSLLMASFISYKTQQQVNIFQLLCIGAWSLCFGIRGILWHQFHDADKDLLSGIKTVVHNMNKKETAITGTILICIECSALGMLLITFGLLLPAVTLACYFLYLHGLSKKWKVSTIIIKPSTDAYRICMNEYYQVFLPFSILASAAMAQPSALIVLFFHLVLFPGNTIRILRESCLLLTNNRKLYKFLRADQP